MQVVRVEAKPGMRREVIVKVTEELYRISVKEQARHNAANRRIREILSALYGVSIERVRIQTGHRGGTKIIHIG